MNVTVACTYTWSTGSTLIPGTVAAKDSTPAVPRMVGPMTNVLFTSDTHLGHAHVAGLRGFANPAEHDEHLVQTWNEHVTKRDTVWVLGDFTLMDVARVGARLDRMAGTKHLILGNHDRAHPIFRGWHNRLRGYYQWFESVSVHGQHRIDGTRALSSHFPYAGEGARDQPDRHVAHRLRDEGMPLLHGHTHDPDQKATVSPAGSPMLHVGWDAWDRPVHLAEVVDWVRSL